nr:sarcosine oxidase subunit gamma family protein [uncultured Cohaesibacter sp.]
MDSQTSLTMQPPLMSKSEMLQTTKDQAISLLTVEGLQVYSLRGDPANRAFLSAVKSLFGVSLPQKSGTTQEKGGCSILWMGPDEWLVIANETESLPEPSQMEEALTGFHHALVDLSHSFVAFSLSGTKTREALSKGCSLDFFSYDWKKGTCANSLLARCDVTIWQRSARPDYMLLVRNSLADYVSDFLLDAIAEYNAL